MPPLRRAFRAVLESIRTGWLILVGGALGEAAVQSPDREAATPSPGAHSSPKQTGAARMLQGANR